MDNLELAIAVHLAGTMPGGHSATEPLPDLLLAYGTCQSRLIPARPRACHTSAQLLVSPKATEHKAALDAIKAEIVAGDDLGPHLSKAAAPDQGLDRMVADFGVHHLHLSTTMEPDGVHFKRSKDLLFAAFRPDDAYLIGVYQHVTDWAREDILATIARNWPEAGIVAELPFVTGLTRQFTDPARLALQQNGVSVAMIEVDGKVFSTTGQSVGGAPYVAQQFRMGVGEIIRQWREDDPAGHLAEAAAAVDAAAGRAVTGDWTAVVRDGYAGLQREDVFHPIVSLSLPGRE
jgi:hypothetical protein